MVDIVKSSRIVRTSIGKYLRFAFAFVEAKYARDELREVGRLTKDDIPLGVVEAGFAAETFRSTMEQAVVPGLERFGIPAEDAWRRRTLGE